MSEAKKLNETNYQNIELTDEGIIFKRRGFLRSIRSAVAYSDVETVMLNEKDKRLAILKKDGELLSIKKGLIARCRRMTDELHKIISEKVENAKAKLMWQSIPLQFDVLNQQINELVVEGDKMNVCDLAELLLIQSVCHGASDIHIEPHQSPSHRDGDNNASLCQPTSLVRGGLRVRYRIDGFFRDIAYIPGHIKNRLISRIKVISNLIIYKHNIPQEGSIRLTVDGLSVDFRVSIIPTIMGEKIVIRAFDILGASRKAGNEIGSSGQKAEELRPLFTSEGKNEAVVDVLFLESLGFTDDVLKGFESLILQNQGTIILTGPSGSGKTTTLYSALRRIHQVRGDSVSIVSIEDPVEYNLEVANQIQVDTHNGLTFAKTLASVLRQDPEVIMVGEIRDPETAEIAIQAGLTGHLVLTTVHSGTAAGVFTRLLDMGLEPFLVASSVRGIVAQRLVRRKTMTNYKGRTAIAELLSVTDDIRELIMKRSTTGVIEEKARELGMQTLKENGHQKVENGITTEEELIRVL